MSIFDELEGKRARRGHAKREPAPDAVSVSLDSAPPATFEAALAVLSDEERGFVRAYIADPGRGAAGAYRAACPDSKLNANKRGPGLLAKAGVALAIRLGRETVARQVAEATKHDRQAAFEEMGRVLQRAMETDQMTAAARAAELRARLCGVLVDKQEIKSSNFSLVFEGMPVAVDVTPRPPALEVEDAQILPPAPESTEDSK